MIESTQNVPSFRIQPATAAHASQIRDLVLGSGLNPTGLDGDHFLVALTPDGEFIGCGQIKPHVDGMQELASVAVALEWRGRGVGGALIQSLIDSHPGELYLMCQSYLGPLYEKFGFQVIRDDEMPKYFRRVSKLPGVLTNLAKGDEHLLIMRRNNK